MIMAMSKSRTRNELRYLPKDIRSIINKAKAAGFLVEHGAKHVKVINPESRQIATIPGTTSNSPRTKNNVLLALRRIGFDARANDRQPRTLQ